MASQQSHKPRRRKRVEDGASTHSNHGAIISTSRSKNPEPAFPLVAFLWPTKGTVSQWVVLPLILMAVGLFRWTTGLWGYSGFQTPPMHGDFEAQRHWMELTIHLPLSQWYFHELEWWGLDYPPLTAYHSWILGKIGNFINPNWFALHTSRGIDDPTLKVFMRATVFVSEYLTYTPAVIIFLRRYTRLQSVNTWEASIALVAILMQPGTILIDHGHFQYNTVMLGFMVASMSSVLAGRPWWGAAFFVASLGFKQMALFYAPAVFSYLLGICIFPRINVVRFLVIGFTTVLSFAVLFAPLLLGAVYDSYRGIPYQSLIQPPLLQGLSFPLNEKSLYYPILLQLTQTIHRIFPFARGLFEDKVANFWCALHTFHKLHHYSGALVQRAALLATLTAILPPCVIFFFKPHKELIPLAFSACSWGFFLFSYQVHEKNVLLPLLPMTLLLGGEGGLLPSTRAWVGFANLLGVWTMFPLLKRDQLTVPYYVISLLWAYLLGLPPVSLSAYHEGLEGGLNLATKILHVNFYLVMGVWHVMEALVSPPTNKPDLWVVGNVLVGAAGFSICYLWCLWTLSIKSGVIAGIWTQRDERKVKLKEK
ncbi:glycosyltransferase family 57 protein [Patellaria atrata CBS 101060]|uniref:Alpha-1,3-glucosyltransferase n=1 Tax=Patellaria atrata CBS 101060 TaxID=1346257 RepID=A0A9P4S5I3_9PEZI|nr:glycosyltransferase family 57 protein [Patellaria atrata CBS 101060]